ncbi:YihY/virulence factor BrkB family protein [Candidatus Bandiella numerosa]|jgi:membrane protein|uniref:YihY/virulence factor BrkB family protein n=1 Tax=Candidatus Bandiella numerosa TaxID=2570586 RepID=UPI00249E35A6|nr:YihY/virulence factor BrkB family protein [Candidatus Bandiella numerosa]WHA05156.1 YihY/virulence factor BrkB family protein [Candidatus Bandiella numerosa]
MLPLLKTTIDITKKFFLCFYKSIEDTIAHDGIEHAGYLSFLLMLSIFPFLFFLMATMKFIIPINLLEQIISSLSDNTEITFDNLIYFLKPRIHEITNAPPNSLLTLAVFTAIWTASSIFEAIRTILNKANRVIHPPSYLFRRFISIVEFIVLIFLTIFIMFSFGIFPTLKSYLSTLLHLKDSHYYLILEQETRLLRDIITIFCGFFLILFLYFFLPNKRQNIFNNIPGTILVLLFWNIFTRLFKYYLSTFSQLNVIYGSIVGVIIALLYFYFCSIIFIFGAEFNYNFFYNKKQNG